MSSGKNAADGEETARLKTADHVDVASVDRLKVPGPKSLFGSTTSFETADYMGALSQRLAAVERQNWYEGDRVRLLIAALGLTLIRDGLLPLVAVYLSILDDISDDEVGNLVGLQGWAMVLIVIPAGLLTDNSYKKQWWAAVALLGLAACSTMELLSEWFFPGAAYLWVHYLMRVGVGLTGPVYDRLLSGITMGVVGLNMFDQQWANMILGGQVFKFVFLGIIIIFSFLGAGWLIFAGCAAVCVLAILAIMAIPSKNIDHYLVKGVRLRTKERERQLATKMSPDKNKIVGEQEKWYVPYLNVFKNKDAICFVFFVFLFHFGNAFLLPLAMLVISEDAGDAAVAWAIGPMIVSELSAFGWTWLLKGQMSKWGRRTIFSFGALIAITARAFLTLWITDVAEAEQQNGGESAWARIAILATMIFDGCGSAVYGLMSMVVAADLMKGSGVFNSYCGMINLADKMGGIASAFLGGQMAAAFGRRVSLIILGGIGFLAAAWYLLLVRETLHDRTVQPEEKKLIKSTPKAGDAPTLYVSGNEKLREVAMRQAGSRVGSVKTGTDAAGSTYQASTYGSINEGDDRRNVAGAYPQLPNHQEGVPV